MAPMQTPTPTLERPDRQQTDPHDQPPGGNGAPQHAHASDEHDLRTDLPKPSTFTIIIVMVVIALLLVALFLLGLIPHLHRIALANSDAAAVASDIPVVSVSRSGITTSSPA